VRASTHRVIVEASAGKSHFSFCCDTGIGNLQLAGIDRKQSGGSAQAATPGTLSHEGRVERSMYREPYS
jgi:hypothetical protein